MRISCAMIVKNESRCLERCLQSVKEMVDEIVVLDTGSTDQTVQIAESLGAKVYHFQWCNDFSAARNEALSHVTGDWVLVVDADEYFTANFRPQLEAFATKYPNAVAKICQKNLHYQDGEPVYSDTYLTRFFPRGHHYIGVVHEQLNTNKERISTDIFVLHDGYVSDNKVARNLPLLLSALEKSPEDTYLLYQVGRQYAIEKNYAQALFYFVKAFETGAYTESFFASLVFDAIFSCIRTASFELGLDFIDFALAHFPDYAELYYYSGILFMEAALFDINRYGHLMPQIEIAYKNALTLGDTIGSDSLTGAGTYLSAHNLAVFYETTGDRSLADYYYNLANSQKKLVYTRH